MKRGTRMSMGDVITADFINSLLVRIESLEDLLLGGVSIAQVERDQVEKSAQVGRSIRFASSTASTS